MEKKKKSCAIENGNDTDIVIVHENNSNNNDSNNKTNTQNDSNSADGVGNTQLDGNKQHEQKTTTTTTVKMLTLEDNRKYFMGEGMLSILFVGTFLIPSTVVIRFLIFRWIDFTSFSSHFNAILTALCCCLSILSYLVICRYYGTFNTNYC